MKTEILKKYYSKDDNYFHIIKLKLSTYEKIEEIYKDFKDFYKACKNDLTDADLVDYNFENYNPQKYNLSKCLISSDTMIKLGTYDDKLFKSLMKIDDFEETTKASCDIVQSRILPHLEYQIPNEDKNMTICYISDLHIPYKIRKNFKFLINDDELNKYLTNKINS